jgi:hypothetical protein
MKFSKRGAIKKIRKQLPNFHPESGQPLNWDIVIYRSGGRYDIQTGEYLNGRLKISITQHNDSIFIDDRVFSYDWKKKELYHQSSCYWR